MMEAVGRERERREATARRGLGRLLPGVVLLALALLLAAPAGAQMPSLSDDPTGTGVSEPPEWAYALPHDLMSPFCPGRTLAACPSPQAAELRQWILFQAAAGQSELDIKEALFAKYGDVMLQEPRAQGGWGISAYVIPVAGFVLGGALVAFVIYRVAGGRGSREPAAPQPVPASRAARSRDCALSDAELERLVEEELAKS